MAAVPFMPLYVADYMADAAHLSTLEHGAYLLLIMAYWQRGEALPDDDKKLARIVGLQGANWRKVAPVLREFFVSENGKLIHHRIERELQHLRDKSLKNRKGGLARAKQMHSKRLADAERTVSHTDTDTDADTDTHIETSPNGDCASANALKPEHVFEKWNEIAGAIGRPRIRDLTPERRQLVRARIAQYGIDDFVAVFGKVAASPFLRGDRNWRGATFDWVMKKGNFQKILEGNYDD